MEDNVVCVSIRIHRKGAGKHRVKLIPCLLARVLV